MSGDRKWLVPDDELEALLDAASATDESWGAMHRLVHDLKAAREELTELRARATYWYEQDGTVTTHAPEVVQARRIAAAKELAAMRAVLGWVPAMLRGMGEHGVTIVLESEAADGQAFAADPGFVTRFRETMRVWSDAAAQAVEKKIVESVKS